jgi:F0F1-type ATP synthase assembly protein I
LPSRSTPPETGNPKGGAARGWTGGLREAAPLLGLGMTLAVTVLAGLGVGHWLDDRLGTRPWFLLLGACLGIAAAMVYFFKTVAGSSKGSDPKP